MPDEGRSVPRVRTFCTSMAVAASLTLLVGEFNPASAEDEPNSPASVEQAVSDAVLRTDQAGTVDGDSASTKTLALKTTQAQGGSIEVPRAANSPITMTVSTGETVAFELPTTPNAKDAEVVDGTAVYSDPTAHSAAAVQPLSDGSVRALVSINDQKAPHSYSFAMHLADGGGAELMDDGSVELVNADGVSYSAIAPAWAVDANGRPVPTSYSLNGSTLVQHVSFGSTSAFPIVADPTFQHDCGVVTCTLRLSRGATRNARDASWLVAAAAAACGPAGPACAIPVALGGTATALAAGRFYEDGDCVGIRYTKVVLPPFSAAWPVRVKARKYNCR